VALATLGAPAAWADDPVPATATTSAEPTPEASPSEEPTVVSESPSPEETGGSESGPVEAGTGGGEGDGVATPTADSAAGTEQAPVEEGTLAAAAEDGRDPRASIGDIDCTHLTVPVTLDNSRSTETVTYRILAGEAWFDEDFSFEDMVEVSAGAIQIVDVPVTEDSVVEVLALDLPAGAEWGTMLADTFLRIDCTDDDNPQDPQARVGSVDCTEMTVDVTLDNSRSEVEMTFIVSVSLAFEDESESFEYYDLPAGDEQAVQVPVIENIPAHFFVGAFGPGGDEWEAWEEGFLVEELFRVNCTPGDEPLASIGEVNCTNLTVPVTLDNTRSALESWFVIYATDEDEMEEPTFYDGFWVAAGAERVVAAGVPDGMRAVVTVDDENQFGPLARETFDVDCVRVLSGRAGPALAATGANGATLPLAGLTLLACGGVLSMIGRRHS
jgi:hypothetical protein